MEHYYTVDKFNRGIRKEHHPKTTKSDRDIKDLKLRVKQIEDIGSLYSVTNTYFSTKGRRIVTVKPAVDKNDVIIKEQLDKAIVELKQEIEKLALISKKNLPTHHYSWGDNVYNLKPLFDQSLSSKTVQ